MNAILNFDYQIFLAINSMAGKSAFVDWWIIFLGQYLVYFIAAGLILYWFFGQNKLKVRKQLFMAFCSFVIARLVITEWIRQVLPRDRPFLTHDVIQLIPKGNEQSFPSGHASALFAIAMGIYFYDRKLGNVLLILSAVVGITRIAAGIHYPIDILGGAVLGIVVAFLVHKYFKKQIEFLAKELSNFSDKVFKGIKS